MGKLCFVFILTSFHLIADSSLKLYHLNLNFVLLDFLSFLSSPDIVSLSDIACKYLPILAYVLMKQVLSHVLNISLLSIFSFI